MFDDNLPQNYKKNTIVTLNHNLKAKKVDENDIKKNSLKAIADYVIKTVRVQILVNVISVRFAVRLIFTSLTF